jgi:mRNA interferase MazF
VSDRQVPDRGDLAYLNFNPQSGHEQAGRRPAIVLSPQAFNQATGFAVVSPITNQKKNYPFEVELPVGLLITGVVLADQVKSLDWLARNIDIVDKAPSHVVQEVLDKIHTFL